MANFVFPCGLRSVNCVIRWGAASNDIQSHNDCGLWFVINSECCHLTHTLSIPSALLLSSTIGSKLTKLGSKSVESQKTFHSNFIFHLWHISGIHLTIKVTDLIQYLKLYVKTWLLYCFTKEWFLTLVGNIIFLRPRYAYMRQRTMPSLLQIMACRLYGANPLSEPMLNHCYSDHSEHILGEP